MPPPPADASFPFPPPLAFGFASPWLLGGLLLAGLPILIHLLFRQNYAETNWAAMRFLMRAVQRHSTRVRLEQLLLLAVRTLIPLCVVLAFAEPVFDLDSEFTSGGPTLRVLVIDTTLSMRVATGSDSDAESASAFDAAREAALRIVQEAGPRDRFALVLIGDHVLAPVLTEPTPDRNIVTEELRGLAASETGGDVTIALRAAGGIVDDVEEPAVVYLLSDFQSTTWAAAASDRVRQELRQLSSAARLVTVPLGGPPANLALVEARNLSGLVPVGSQAQLSATVANSGPQDASDVEVQCLIDGEAVASRRVTVPAGGTASVTFDPVIREADTELLSGPEQPAASDRVVEFRLPEDRLSEDNVRRLMLRTRSSVSVLLVNSGATSARSDSSIWHFRFALSPVSIGTEWGGFFRTETAAEADLLAVDFSRYDCVVIGNPSELTARSASRLAAFVRSGGGLVLTLGDHTASMSAAAQKQLEPLLAGTLGELRGSTEDVRDAWLLTAEDLTHPIINPFEGNPGTGLETTLVFQYQQLTVPDDSPARVVLRYASGDPTLLTSSVGRGRVVVFTTALDADSSTWATENASFIPIVEESVRYAVGGSEDGQTFTVGDSYRMVRSAERVVPPVTFTAPDGRVRTLVWDDEEDLYTTNTGPIWTSGTVTLALPGETPVRLAVNPPATESDLRTLTAPEQDDLFPTGTRTLTDAAAGGTIDATAKRPSIPPLSTRLLWIALGLLVVEQALTSRFALGVFLLLGLAVAIASLLIWAGWWLSGGLLLFGTTLLGMVVFLARRDERQAASR